MSPCEHCQKKVDRREFLAQSTLLAVVGVLAACGSSSTGPSGPLTVTLANFSALATVGGIAVVDDGSQSGRPVAVVRTGATAYAAFSLICPHRGCMVGINGGSFLCPCHGAQFAADGSWIGGQPTSNLSSYSTTYDAAAGTLTIV